MLNNLIKDFEKEFIREFESARPAVEDIVNRFTSVIDFNGYRHRFYKEDNSLLLEIGLPGFVKEDVSIEIEDGKLKVSFEADGTEFWKQSFKKSFALYNQINEAKVSATMENGLLKVDLPLANESKARTVNIK